MEAIMIEGECMCGGWEGMCGVFVWMGMCVWKESWVYVWEVDVWGCAEGMYGCRCAYGGCEGRVCSAWRRCVCRGCVCLGGAEGMWGVWVCMEGMWGCVCGRWRGCL